MSGNDKPVARGPIAWMVSNRVTPNLLMLVLILGGLARSMQSIKDRLARQADDLINNLDFRADLEARSLDRNSLLRYHDMIVLEVLRKLGSQAGAWRRPPGERALRELLHWLRRGRPGTWRPLGGGQEMSLDRSRLWVHGPLPKSVRVVLERDKIRELPGRRFGWTRRDPSPSSSRRLLMLPVDPERHNLVIRSWAPGDRIRTGAGMRRKVSDLLSEAGLSRPEKARQLVLEDRGRILWIPGLCVAWPLPAIPAGKGWEIIWMEQ